MYIILVLLLLFYLMLVCSWLYLAVIKFLNNKLTEFNYYYIIYHFCRYQSESSNTVTCLGVIANLFRPLFFL
jgi:hypothetical protein